MWYIISTLLLRKIDADALEKVVYQIHYKNNLCPNWLRVVCVINKQN